MLAWSLSLASAGNAAQERVVVVAAAQTAEVRTLQAALRELLESPDLAVEFRRTASVQAAMVLTPRAQADPPLARVWLDMRPPERAVLYLVDAAWERVLVRFIPRVAGKPELLHEQVGQILLTSIEALRQGGSIGIKRENAREIVEAELPSSLRSAPPRDQSQEPPDASKARSVLRLGAIAMYELQTFASALPLTHGPGVGVSATTTIAGVRSGGEVSLRYRFIRVPDEPIGASLDTVAGRSTVLASPRLGDNWLIEAGAGFGIDFVRMQPEASVAEFQSESEEVFVQGVALAFVGVAYDKQPLNLALRTTMELDLVDTRYVYEVDAQRLVAVDPYRVRPGVLLQLGFR